MNNKIQPTDYILKSMKTGKTYKDTGWMLNPPEKEPSLIRAIYSKKQLEVKDDSYGLYKFADWLPIKKMLKGSYAPHTYKSEKLAQELGLSNLYITFSGYWPEKNIFMKTCSFKETEAYTVCGRMAAMEDKILVVASAGNTARAFARVCSDNNIPLLLSVPEDYIDTLWFDEPIKDNVKLIVSRSGSDYYDSIYLSNLACELDNFIPEGGAKNVARREGMGTTVLSAVTTIGKIPDYYFQAVGSSTGAISAWEANLRLIEDGNYGNNKMKLMVSQNSPFTLVHDAWKSNSRELPKLDDNVARGQVENIISKVLSNRKPVYSISGGLYDAMKDAGGDVLLATNEELNAASDLFEKLEGIDIHSAAAVATASLIKTVKENKIDKDSIIMLNITGGGEGRFAKDNKLHFLKPSLVFDINPDLQEVKEKLEKLF
ncbi:MAG: cysteate synthase [Bacteroidota bacterium]|nr:cysteate synthase [Bacteroidota bacterium]